MVQYNFKKIAVVPTAKEFIDVILSKTQRKTPSEVCQCHIINQSCKTVYFGVLQF